MKTILTTTLILFFSLALRATTIDPCCIDESNFKTFKVPIENINLVNNYKGNKIFKGNGGIPSSISMDDDILSFTGTQYIESSINRNKRQGILSHGVITYKQVNLVNNSFIISKSNTTTTIEKLIVNQNPEIYVEDKSAMYIIEGKTYKAGDTVKGIVIKLCNGSLPVTFGKIEGKITDTGLKVNFEVLKEYNNKWFVLWVSEDGNNFIDIASTNSKGNSETKVDYTMTLPLDKLTFASFGFAIFILMVFIFGTLVPNNKGKFTLVVLFIVGLIACSKKSQVEENKKMYKYFYIEQWDIDGTKTKSNTYKFKY